MSIYDDFSEHGLDAHSIWVGRSWLADCALYTRHSDVVHRRVCDKLLKYCNVNKKIILMLK